MYATVPSTVPASVPATVVESPDADEGVDMRASPKSRILTTPSRVIKTFSGLRSRWTMPCECAAERPCAMASATFRALGTGHRALRRHPIDGHRTLGATPRR